MEVYINPPSPRGPPSRQFSHRYRRAPSPFPADELEMSDIGSLKPTLVQSETASEMTGTAPLLATSKSSDVSNNTSTKRRRNWKKGARLHFHGWRAGVILCSSTAATVLLMNIILTIWASTKNGISGGLATVQDGSCQDTKGLSLWLHLIINVLSTVLLAASNYCMQCLSSPTREEIDQAHSRHIWLDIGVPSVRNLRHIAWNRIILWWLLVFSGVPLHLFYNSAIFSTLSSQEYDVFAASPELITGNGANRAVVNPSGATSELSENSYSPINISDWQILSNSDCMRAYGKDFISTRSNVVAISSDLKNSDPIQWLGERTVTYSGANSEMVYAWMCYSYRNLMGQDHSRCNIDHLLQYSSTWELQLTEDGPSGSSEKNISVQYCLSKPVKEHCRLQLSLIIMAIVIFCNFMKALCMYLVLRQQRSPPLVTLGDAIESFLHTKDPTTGNMCLADKSKFSRKDWAESTRTYLRNSHPWFASASLRRWLTCNILCISTVIVAGVLLSIGLQNDHLTSKSISYLWRLGFGAVTSESMVNWNIPGGGGLLVTVLVANSPQALLSFLFLTYNGLYTCMLMASEWSDYAYDRKPLRVTNPVGDQRSTYRLQLPYKYGIPLTTLSGVLHWLVSQSLFLARVASFRPDGSEPLWDSISTVGYSCIAIITVIIIGTIVIALGIANGFRRLRPGMPIVGSCSAAISAACHQSKEDVDAAVRPVLWGAISGQAEGVVGHCCFTTLEVSPPVEGEVYAGRRSEEQAEEQLGVVRRLNEELDILPRRRWMSNNPFLGILRCKLAA